MTKNKISGIIIMKNERVWDYSYCQIGKPCSCCVDTCSFKVKTYSLDKDQEEKEKENERIAQVYEGSYQ